MLITIDMHMHMEVCHGSSGARIQFHSKSFEQPYFWDENAVQDLKLQHV